MKWDEKLSREFLASNLPFWKKLSEGQKKYILEHTLRQMFQKGEILKDSSSQCAGLLLIDNGQVRAYILSESGKEITLYRLFDRDICIFSASCIIKQITIDIYLEIEKRTTAYLIPTGVYMKLIEESMAILEFTNLIMANRFSTIMEQMEQALFTSLDKRLALFLQEQVRLEKSRELKITHEKIANHLGTAREVVTRALQHFQKEGMVVLSRGKIEVVNLELLEDFIENYEAEKNDVSM